MSANKHTKGPWTLSEKGDYSDFSGHSRVILTIRLFTLNRRGYKTVKHVHWSNVISP